jgi:hypothetical protein
MRIEEIDKNFARGVAVTKDGMTEYPIPHDSFALYGIFYDEKEGCFARMDIAVANEINDGVRYLCKHTAGGRLRFATDSNIFKLSVTYNYLWVMSHMPILGSSGFVLFEETDKGERFVANFMPEWKDEKGFSGEAKLSGEGMRSYTLYFPLYNDIQTSIGETLRKNYKYIISYDKSSNCNTCILPENKLFAEFIIWHQEQLNELYMVIKRSEKDFERLGIQWR